MSRLQLSFSFQFCFALPKKLSLQKNLKNGNYNFTRAQKLPNIASHHIFSVGIKKKEI
jgi:hypothetical protein